MNGREECPYEQGKGQVVVERKIRCEEEVEGQLVWRVKIGGSEHSFLGTEERVVSRGMVVLIQRIGSQLERIGKLLGLSGDRNGG